MVRINSVSTGSLSIAVICIALVGCAPMGAPVSATGQVIESSGRGADVGSTCRVSIINEGRGGYVCRVEVECEGDTIYGGPSLGGYAHCEAEEGRWVHVFDHWLAAEDGDPYMDWDTTTGIVEVRTAEGRTRVEVGS